MVATQVHPNLEAVDRGEVPTFRDVTHLMPSYTNREQARQTESWMRAGMIQSLRNLQEMIEQFCTAATEYVETEAVITPLGTLPAFSDRLAAEVLTLEGLARAMDAQAIAFGWQPAPSPDAQAAIIVAGAEPAAPLRDPCWRCGKATVIGLRRALGDGRFEHTVAEDCVTP